VRFEVDTPEVETPVLIVSEGGSTCVVDSNFGFAAIAGEGLKAP